VPKTQAQLVLPVLAVSLLASGVYALAHPPRGPALRPLLVVNALPGSARLDACGVDVSCTMDQRLAHRELLVRDVKRGRPAVVEVFRRSGVRCLDVPKDARRVRVDAAALERLRQCTKDELPLRESSPRP
jgi:hypothetical protein